MDWSFSYFLPKLLNGGNDYPKNETTDTIKEVDDNKDFDMNDVIEISRMTFKQDELFDYVKTPN